MFELKKETIDKIVEEASLPPEVIKLEASKAEEAIADWEKEKGIRYPEEYDNSENGL